MNEDNPPMLLPNGQVYSLEVGVGKKFDLDIIATGISYAFRMQALQEMAANHDGIITCPKTNETYGLSDLKKVFIS